MNSEYMIITLSHFSIEFSIFFKIYSKLSTMLIQRINEYIDYILSFNSVINSSFDHIMIL